MGLFLRRGLYQNSSGQQMTMNVSLTLLCLGVGFMPSRTVGIFLEDFAQEQYVKCLTEKILIQKEIECRAPAMT